MTTDGHRVCVYCARNKLHIDTTGMAVRSSARCAICNLPHMTIHVVAVREELLYVAPPPPPPPPAWVVAYEKERDLMMSNANSAMRCALEAGSDAPEAIYSALGTLAREAFEQGWQAALKAALARADLEPNEPLPESVLDAAHNAHHEWWPTAGNAGADPTTEDAFQAGVEWLASKLTD